MVLAHLEVIAGTLRFIVLGLAHLEVIAVLGLAHLEVIAGRLRFIVLGLADLKVITNFVNKIWPRYSN